SGCTGDPADAFLHSRFHHFKVSVHIFINIKVRTACHFHLLADHHIRNGFSLCHSRLHQLFYTVEHISGPPSFLPFLCLFPHLLLRLALGECIFRSHHPACSR